MSSRENRQYERFVPRHPTYVYLGNDRGSVGRVTGIGRGGLGFDYVKWQDRPDTSGTGKKTGVIDLVVKDEGPRISRIPVELVYEKPAANAFFYWATRYRVMSCGLKFGPLSPDQQKAIDTLLGDVSQGKTV